MKAVTEERKVKFTNEQINKTCNNFIKFLKNSGKDFFNLYGIPSLKTLKKYPSQSSDFEKRLVIALKSENYKTSFLREILAAEYKFKNALNSYFKKIEWNIINQLEIFLEALKNDLEKAKINQNLLQNKDFEEIIKTASQVLFQILVTTLQSAEIEISKMKKNSKKTKFFTVSI